MRLWMLIPLAGAAAVLVVFMLGLQRDDVNELPSTFIDRDVPAFELPGLGEHKGLAAADMKGSGVQLINIWASWCGPCRIEHPQLMKLAEEGVVIHGLNYKDAPENALGFLRDLGNPYDRIGADQSGRTGIEFGVYGVPETFVVDAEGKIRYKVVGPIVERNIGELREAIRKAAGG